MAKPEPNLSNEFLAKLVFHFCFNVSYYAALMLHISSQTIAILNLQANLLININWLLNDPAFSADGTGFVNTSQPSQHVRHAR